MTKKKVLVTTQNIMNSTIRKYYYVEKTEEGVSLVPVDGTGDTAHSWLESDSYAYSHGGELFRAACEKARALF
jgi:hypothetical protein